MKAILIAVVVFVTLVAPLMAAASNASLSVHAEDAMTLSNTLTQVRSLPSPEMKFFLLNSRDETPCLDRLMGSPSPKNWVNEWTCDPMLRVVWASMGLSELSGDLAKRLGGKVQEQGARACLMQVTAFSQLCMTKDAAVWEFLLNRSKQDPTLLDVCILGAVVWGNRFRLQPSPEQGPICLDDVPLSPDKWTLPPAEPFEWRTLLDGKNGVYRLLAMKAMDAWAKEDEGVAVIRRTLKDDFLAVRQEALLRMERLPVKNQVEVLQENREWLETQTVWTSEEQETRQWYSIEISRRLRQATEKDVKNQREDNAKNVSDRVEPGRAVKSP